MRRAYYRRLIEEHGPGPSRADRRKERQARRNQARLAEYQKNLAAARAADKKRDEDAQRSS